MPRVHVHILKPGADQCTQGTDTQERPARPHKPGTEHVGGGVWDAPVVEQELLHDVQGQNQGQGWGPPAGRVPSALKP